MVKKILISTTNFGEYDRSDIAKCERLGYKLIMNPYGRKMKGDELVRLAGDAVGLIAGTEALDAATLSALPGLKVISRCGAGIDNVDLAAAKRLGMKVLNTPDAPTVAVAELTVGLILSLLRKTFEMDKAVRAGKWTKLMGNLLSDKKVAIIGFGRIGRKVAELLGPFKCELAYVDPFVEDGISGLRRLPKERAVKWADIVSCHVSAKERIIGEKEISSMRKGGWILNISRGGVVDENALCRYLKDGHLAGAALDVFEEEPYGGPLRELPNVILTPHIGSYAKEARIKMERESVENLLKGLKEG